MSYRWVRHETFLQTDGAAQSARFHFFLALPGARKAHHLPGRGVKGVDLRVQSPEERTVILHFALLVGRIRKRIHRLRRILFFSTRAYAVDLPQKVLQQRHDTDYGEPRFP